VACTARYRPRLSHHFDETSWGLPHLGPITSHVQKGWPTRTETKTKTDINLNNRIYLDTNLSLQWFSENHSRRNTFGRKCVRVRNLHFSVFSASCLDVLMSWCLDVFMSSRLDVLMSWCFDVLMSWCLDVLMSWCLDVSMWYLNVIPVLIPTWSSHFSWMIVVHLFSSSPHPWHILGPRYWHSFNESDVNAIPRPRIQLDLRK